MWLVNAEEPHRTMRTAFTYVFVAIMHSRHPSDGYFTYRCLNEGGVA